MTNATWLARSRAAVWHPCTQMKAHETLPLVPIARGEGAWLYDFDGRRYLDAVSSWWVNLFGHAQSADQRALVAQLGELEHVMLAGFTHRRVVELSERLARARAGGLGHAFYASDGASASEIALKMASTTGAIAAGRKSAASSSLAGSYHGETLGALAVTDVPLFRDATRRCSRRTTRCLARSARGPARRTPPTLPSGRGALERPRAQPRDDRRADRRAAGAGRGGMAMYDRDYLARARELCTRYDVLLIADEIMTGFGRTGTLFACEQAAIAPDFLCLSKGITGGYLPLSCVLPPTTSTPRSTTTTRAAASCIRIRTPATRSRAAPRSRCSTSSPDDDVIAGIELRAQALERARERSPRTDRAQLRSAA
jgi:adenosylmethionine-8-amino-7-oxononanoate aminotransferase